jgi:hypothetical protein
MALPNLPIDKGKDMSTSHPHRAPRPRTVGLTVCFQALGILAALALAGCLGPNMNAVANRLREENIKQKQQITGLQDQLKNRDATIHDLQQHFATNNPPLPTLPPERLAQIFTASRLEIQSSTDAADLGDGKKGFRVFLRTYADDGQLVPAAGQLRLEAFELPAAPGEPRRIGVWNFTPEEVKKAWFTGLGTNHFAFSCPWDKPPESSAGPLVFKATLRDALTGQTLMAQLDKKITLLAP